MKIQTKITLMTTLVMGAVVLSTVINLLWMEKSQVQAEFASRIDARTEGVMRIARESLLSRDELMLLSYLKVLMQEYPDIELAAVSREGHKSVFGTPHDDLIYRVVSISEPKASSYVASPPPSALSETAQPGPRKPIPPSTFIVQLGFSKAALAYEIRRAQLAVARKVLLIAVFWLALGLAVSLGVGRHLALPLLRLAAAVQKIGAGNLNERVPSPSADEIGDLARNFNRMADSLRESAQFKEDMLSTLTHELNNPLVGLKGFLEVLQSSDRPQTRKDIQETYGTMAEAVDQMELSLKNALDFLRAGARPRLAPERLCLNDILKDAVRFFSLAARGHGVQLTGPEENAPAIRISADRELMRRVAINLVSNALKFTPTGGKVSVQLTEGPEDVGFSVADTGYGIAPEDQEKIFTKFYRAPGPDGKPQKIPGSGLGLMIAKQAVDLHEGRIWVSSAPGQGSTFYVALPRGRGSDEADEPKVRSGSNA